MSDEAFPANNTPEGEHMPEVNLGDSAEGLIQPNDDQAARFPEIKGRILSGDFHEPVDSSIVSGCIDGRCGSKSPRASSAGGTISLMVARDLTRDYKDGFKTTAELMRKTIETLDGRGHPIGDHVDDHAEGEKTGCGANDNLARIYRVIAQKGGAIRQLARELGFDELVDDDEVCERIEQAAADRFAFSEPVELIEAIKETPKATIETLHGDHNEAVIVVNTRPGTTLYHQLMADELGGEEFEAFDVDAWAFEDSARAVADNPDDAAEVSAKTTALLYYNFATALALCGPNMPIVVLREP
ncbi:hypothetical protein CSA80_01570 [Candidatus Saccharibacteria bacterium]|nr:MAG: hypothetical protein CSA80_01570 [Candidatus Saccharibacteria bacterium]